MLASRTMNHTSNQRLPSLAGTDQVTSVLPEGSLNTINQEHISSLDLLLLRKSDRTFGTRISCTVKYNKGQKASEKGA